jgi:hypothetical protein
MPGTRPFSELLDMITADPIRRERIAAIKREMEDVLAQEEQRTQAAEADNHPVIPNGEPRRVGLQGRES